MAHAASRPRAPRPSAAPGASAPPPTQEQEADPMLSQQEWLTLLQQSQSAWMAASRQALQQGGPSPGVSMQVSRAFLDLFAHMAADPAGMMNRQAQFWQQSMQLWTDSAQRFLGQKDAPLAAPAGKDKRFKDAAWEQNAVYAFLRQSYLLVREHLQEAVSQVDGLAPQSAKAVEFYTRQLLDAMNPANSAMTNPEVLRATMESKGENLLQGWQNLLADMQEGRIRMCDARQFQIGENLAATPGSVVFQNDLMQLIQYAPSTEKVHAVPILLTPAWINKFYILDLGPENSLVRWLTEQGFTVFMISWANPDERYAQTRFDDYMLHGPLAAMEVIGKITGSEKIHLAGYCLGGTLQAILLAYLTAKGEADRVASATYLTTMLDFSEPGDLGVFIDEEQIAEIEGRMAQRGYLDGREMAATFNLLRANDLIWSFVVNNYMLGKSPLPFDLLYWNADATRLPAAMHGFYLRNMYLHNRLKDPGGIIVDRIAIDLHAVKTPSYMLSAREDHIAPWKSTYAGTRIFQGPTRFVLAASGHIAGVVNPPAKQKYNYSVHPAKEDTAEAWDAAATNHPGSWWGDWAQWLAPKSGEKVAARTPGKGAFKALELAPGSYVRVMCA